MADKNSLSTEQYLARFNHGKSISLDELWCEMDRVWDSYQLDNRKHTDPADLQQFYSHPVWILNGLVSERDPTSVRHREALATFVRNEFDDRNITVADYGGGSGVLAQFIVNRADCVERVDIVEPWPPAYFCDRYVDSDKINYVANFRLSGYDVVVAQDVLEHVANPIETALACVDAVRLGGVAIFANCFHPVIKCHLPRTFYLRHTFNYVVGSDQLRRMGGVEGAGHARVFQKLDHVDAKAFKRRALIARLIGSSLNRCGEVLSMLRRRGAR